MSPCPLATLPLRIDPRRIAFLKCILEGYDGMALMSTVNAKDGDILIRYPPFFHDDLLAIIDDVALRLFPAHAQ